MIKDITLGQFFPGDSFLHRLDPRTKVISSLIYLVAVFAARNVFCFAAIFLVTLVIVFASQISLKVILRGIRPILFVLLFTMIINLFWTTGERLLVDFWIIRIYAEGVIRAFLMALRVVMLIVGTSVILTYTTSPIALTDAIEQLLGPLKKIKVPVHEFSMMMTIALRFIPTLIEETDKIMSAQKARGADFSTGSLVKRIKALIPILVPLFVSAFKRAEDLAIAMECRCYRGGEGRTKLHHLTFRGGDYAMMIFLVLLTVAIFVGNSCLPIGSVL